MTTIERTPALHDLLQRVEDMRPVIERNLEWSEQNRRLADEVTDAMLAAGLFRMTVPRAFGGYEMHPVDTLRVIYALSKLDSAAGWNLMIGSGGPSMTAFLPQETGEEIYAGGPDVINAGALNPPARATRVEGGWRITGRTPFASGCHRAHWLAMLSVEYDGERPARNPETGQPIVFIAFFPASQGRIIDTWNPMGMRGTGSADIAVDDLFIPERHARLSLEHLASAFRGPLYRTPGYAISGQAAPAVAAAENAVDQLVVLARHKVPGLSRTTLSEREIAQHHIGKARTLVEAAKNYLFSSVAGAYEAAVAERVADETKKQVQMAACFAADAAAQAVDLVYQAAGTSGFSGDLEFERHYRDVHTIAQHAGHSLHRFTSIGKVELGMPGDVPLLRD